MRPRVTQPLRRRSKVSPASWSTGGIARSAMDECDRQWTSRTGAQEEAGESQIVIEKQWWSVPAGGSARLHRRPQGHVRAREPRDADLGDGAARESARGVYSGEAADRARGRTTDRTAG